MAESLFYHDNTNFFPGNAHSISTIQVWLKIECMVTHSYTFDYMSYTAQPIFIMSMEGGGAVDSFE